jgi:hypothetical protein
MQATHEMADSCGLKTYALFFSHPPHLDTTVQLRVAFHNFSEHFAVQTLPYPDSLRVSKLNMSTSNVDDAF